MMPVAIPRCSGKDGDNNVRAERADDLHDIAEHGIVRPVQIRLFGRLREPEVVCAREVLVRTVDATGREELLRANNAERFAELVADQVLATVTAREREIRGLDVLPAREPRDEARVLVVRVRG